MRRMKRKGIDDIFDEMQNLLGEFQEMGREFTGVSQGIPVDIRSEEDELVLTADMPGMSKEDINIRADSEKINISAESTEEISEHNEKYFKRERSSRTVHRSVYWPEPIDPETVKAQYDNGVLEVRAKREERSGRDIDIE
jgi:HSP20 family protein